MHETLEHHDIEGLRPRVVVGVDGSAGSIGALRAGERAAAARGGTLVAVTAWELPGIVARPPVVIPDLREPAAALLEEALADAFGGRSLVPIRTVVASGTAATVLLEECRNADLLVVGSRGHGGFAGLLLGSVSMACAAHSTSPVLVTHPADQLPKDGRAQPGTRVVAGVGGASDARTVLLFAAEAAQELEAELLAVASWSNTAVAGDFRDELEDAAERALASEIAVAFGADPPTRLRVEACDGSPAAVLVEQSRWADLVVVGRTTRSELAGVLLGAVSLAVAEHAQAPVLIIPPGARIAAARDVAPLLASARP
jgi:nucleotide-binding universal stress UspA family protein